MTVGDVTATIVDVFAPEFVDDGTGTFVQTANILSASAGDLVGTDIGVNSLGVDNPSISDDDFFASAGLENRDFNDGEGLVISFDVDVSLTELDLISIDDGTLTATIPSIGSFDFVNEELVDDLYVDPFGLNLIPAGTPITFEFLSPTVADASVRIEGFAITTEPRMGAVMKGDVDMNGVVDFADIPAFIAILQAG